MLNIDRVVFLILNRNGGLNYDTLGGVFLAIRKILVGNKISYGRP